jgi:hypothetical protein
MKWTKIWVGRHFGRLYFAQKHPVTLDVEEKFTTDESAQR